MKRIKVYAQLALLIPIWIMMLLALQQKKHQMKASTQ